MRVPDGLATLPACVEHDPVAAGVDALGDRDLMCLADKLVEQPAARGGERGDVRIVVARDHQDVRGRLRGDIAECDSPLTVKHDRRRDVSGRDPAEQAVWHSTIIVAWRRHAVLDLGLGNPVAFGATRARATRGRSGPGFAGPAGHRPAND